MPITPDQAAQSEQWENTILVGACDLIDAILQAKYVTGWWVEIKLEEFLPGVLSSMQLEKLMRIFVSIKKIYEEKGWEVSVIGDGRYYGPFRLIFSVPTMTRIFNMKR